MQLRTLTRVVDARATQHRVVLWFDCGHTVSLSRAEVALKPEGFVDVLRATKSWSCPHCPTLPVTPSPRRLWREAGEP